MAAMKQIPIFIVVPFVIASIAISFVVAQPKPEEGTPADPPDSEERRNQVIASYTGGKITVGDMEDRINQQSPFMRKRYQTVQQRESLLSDMIRHDLLAQEAEKRGYANDEKVVYTIKQQAVQSLIKNEFDNKLTLESIDKKEVQKYYNDNIDQFVRPERRRVSHILLSTLKEAQKLMAQAKKADVRGFRDLARKNSIDEATKLRGGDLRYFDKKGKVHGSPDTSIEASIVQAAFRLKAIGDVAPKPVKVEGGFSIIKLSGKRDAHSRSFKDAEMTIRKQLWRVKRKELVDNFIASLRKKYSPEIHPDLINAIKIESGPPGKHLRPGFPTAPVPRRGPRKP